MNSRDGSTAKADKDADLAQRRRRILEAAKTVFASRGGLSVGLRPIATEAGVTTGAIYAVFSGKEDIYAALLEKSLADLAAAVAGAAAREPKAGAALHAAVTALFEYYQSNAFEADLGLHLFDRSGAKGLGAERDAVLNTRLGETLAVFEACYARLGAREQGGPLSPRALANALFAALIGVNVMASTGRDRSVRSDAGSTLDSIVALSPLGPTRMELNKPVIGAVEGPAVAGGCELALWCDVRVMAETAYFGVYGRRWGVSLMDGGLARPPRLVGQGQALEIAMTGREVEAEECRRIGLCERVVPHGRAPPREAGRMAAEIARFPPGAVRADRRSIIETRGMPVRDALMLEWANGIEAIRREGIAGAGRFRDGVGRHGDFSKI